MSPFCRAYSKGLQITLVKPIGLTVAGPKFCRKEPILSLCVHLFLLIRKVDGMRTINSEVILVDGYFAKDVAQGVGDGHRLAARLIA